MSLRDIAVGRYIHRDSPIHHLDPRTKLAALLCLMTALFAGGGWAAIGVCAGVAAGVGGMAGFSPLYLLRTLAPFKWLLVFTLLLNVLFVGGHILIEAPLPYGGITREGLSYGGLYTVRIALLVLLASLLTLTTEPITLVNGVERLLSPLRRVGVNSHDVAITMMLTIRFIPMLLDEAHTIRKAHAARGMLPGGGVRKRLRAASAMLTPLVATSLRRAEQLALAMDCRLYGIYDTRTSYDLLRFTRGDFAAAGITLIFCAAMVIL